jgi:hypothetical protein
MNSSAGKGMPFPDVLKDGFSGPLFGVDLFLHYSGNGRMKYVKLHWKSFLPTAREVGA